MSIKGVLREELENSLQMEKNYAKELAKLPAGSLVRRIIKGREYYYLIFREKGRFRAVYRGKACAAEIEKYGRVKEYRAKYRRLLSQAKKQIRFFKERVTWKRGNMNYAARSYVD